LPSVSLILRVLLDIYLAPRYWRMAARRFGLGESPNTPVAIWVALALPQALRLDPSALTILPGLRMPSQAARAPSALRL